MKLNWGHKLTFFTVLFMLFIIACVVFMIKQDVQLVDNDYYEKGIKYQEVIDQSKESYKLISLELDSVEPALTVNVIDSLTHEIKGDLFFYRPSDKSKDFNTAVTCKYGQPFRFPLTSLDKGNWKVTIIWEDALGKHQFMKEISI